MPRRCGVCGNKKRDEIDRLLVGRAHPFRYFQQRYGIPLTVVYRHYCEHLPSTLAKAQQAKQVANADDLLGRLLELVEDTKDILRTAKEAKDHPIALAAITRAEKQIELQAKLAGQLRDGPTVNVLVTTEWRQVQQVITAALTGYPEARRSVALALSRLGADAAV